ncbi:MAG: hypothetical protein ACRD3P_09110 [Terriglobales bacterium]
MAITWDLDKRIHPLPLMIGIVAILWILLYRQYLSILASWLYARLTLRTDVTFTEARALRKLFQLDVSAKWIPLSEVKKLPSEQRHDAVLIALQRMGPGRKAMLL